jgi:hypothetical protein
MGTSFAARLWNHPLGALAALSLGLAVMLAYDAAIQQNLENQFGPTGLGGLPYTPGFHRLAFTWYPAAAAAVLPVAWLIGLILAHRRQRARSRAGLCPACAYDLTGNVSGVCPECGTHCEAAVPKPLS